MAATYVLIAVEIELRQPRCLSPQKVARSNSGMISVMPLPLWEDVEHTSDEFINRSNDNFGRGMVGHMSYISEENELGAWDCGGEDTGIDIR
jgi:hypothetical protein